MRSVGAFITQCLGISLLGTMSIATLPSYLPHAREIPGKVTAAMPLSSSAPEQNNTTELFSRMTARHHWQETHLNQLSAVRTYKML